MSDLAAQEIRNIAIIAHVDHGKTTMVDQLLKQTGTLGERAAAPERIMDSNDLEKERGITILSKNAAINWKGVHINLVDTPGHADFGGEVERILSMVDAVLLLVDAVDGPMPQTRFVTQKAFEWGLKPIVVVNKVDRDGARPDWVVDQVFELFDSLGATNEQLDFQTIYASAINGVASLTTDGVMDSLDPLLDCMIETVSPPKVDLDGPLQMRISSLSYSSYVGVIGVGRIERGKISPNMQVVVIDRDGESRNAKVLQVLGHEGLDRIEVKEACAGDIVAITGIADLSISDTLCDPKHPEALPALNIDAPTVSMTFQVNTSPFAGLDGKYVTSRRILERLEQELIHNVALRVEPTDSADAFMVSGRGELHLSVLIETMRREGYELAVSKPKVILKEIDGEICEPYEQLSIDIEESGQGGVMERLGERGGQLTNMSPSQNGWCRLEYTVPARGLIGFRTEFMTLSSGSGIMHHSFSHYGPKHTKLVGGRIQGALVSSCPGKALAYAIFNLQARGRMFIGPKIEVYEGMIVGMSTRSDDLVINVTKAKQLTNIRAAGTDENILLTPPVVMSLERALEFINEDELVEVTPNFIRLRKRYLKAHERKRTQSGR